LSVEIIGEKFSLKSYPELCAFSERAHNDCEALTKIYENATFYRFRCLSVEIVEEKNRQKVIHSQLNLCSLNLSVDDTKSLGIENDRKVAFPMISSLER